MDSDFTPVKLGGRKNLYAMDMTIAARLKEQKEKHGDSLRKLASVSGAGHQTIANWIAGEVKNIPDEPLQNLARHWGVSFLWLKYGKDHGPAVVEIDDKALEAAYTVLETVSGDMGASLPLNKRTILLRQFYELAITGRLDRRTAESLIALAS